MSVFSNPASGAAEQAAEYIEAVLGLVEGRDALQVLRETPEFVRGFAEGLPPAVLGIPESPGKWSMAAVVQHLADTEVVWAWRIRLVLAENRPVVTGFDQDLWAERLGYDEVDMGRALSVFDALRGSTLRLLERASPEDMRRVGLHVERGEESVAHMIRLNAGHDLLHRNQLERIRDAVAGSAA